VILDLGPIPVYSRRAWADEHGVFFDVGDERADTRHRDDGQRPKGEAEAPVRRSAPSSTRAGERGLVLQPVQVAFAVAAGVIVAALLLSGGHGREPVRLPGELGDTPPAPSSPLLSQDPARTPSLLAQLDELAARSDRLLARRMLAEDGARALAVACLTGVASVSVTDSEVKGRCKPSPNVGTSRLPERARVAEDRAGALVRVGEPAPRGTDTALGGLAFGGPRG
jgi:hypothetical protein